MSVVERKSSKHQAKTTSSTLTGTKQKGAQVKMSTAKIERETIDDTSATTSVSANNVYDKIYNMVGKGASTSMGQFTIEKMDNLLTIVEKTAKWSLPEDLTSSSKYTKENISPKLERPCGWVPFLFLIVTLRCARVGLSFGSIMIGNEPVTPESMVHFFQTRRRKLRAIKYQGLKSLRNKQKADEDRAKRTGIVEQLTSIFNLLICRPGKFISCNNQTLSSVSSTGATTISAIDTTTTFKNEKKTSNIEDNDRNVNTLNNLLQIQAQKRPSQEDDASANECDSDEELHCTELLDKYGDKSSDFDDPDYIPNVEDGEVISSETDQGSDDDDTDEGVSDDDTINNEIVLIQDPKNLLAKDLNDVLGIISTPGNMLPKENGPATLDESAGGGGSDENVYAPPENESNESAKQVNSSSSSILPSRNSPTLSDSGVKSTAINQVRVSPKIGSPLIHDGPTNNYGQSPQLPSVVVSSAPSTSLIEDVIPHETIINTNEMLTYERLNTENESNKEGSNNLKSQSNHQQKNQQNKRSYYNNYKHNRGRKLH